MPINRKKSVFLFAHQDDEIGVLYEIERTLASGDRAICVYLTNGEWRGTTSAARNRETLRVLARLGLSDEDVWFLGDETGISPNQLPARLRDADAILSMRLDRLRTIRRFVTFAWEGGHEDHDAANWLAIRHAEQRGLLEESRTFPFYRASLRRIPNYTMFEPLPENGIVTEASIPLKDRVRYLHMCLGYPSQALTFLGLLPFVFKHYLVRGTQQLQPLSKTRAGALPHEGSPLYEIRGRARFVDVVRHLKALPLE